MGDITGIDIDIMFIFQIVFKCQDHCPLPAPVLWYVSEQADTLSY